ncbi:hypothetical protein V5799_000122 [Amblyomma americanum]|uniref:TIL domain-containing protein n=1 Tax=Amblyomma americanum TaxID=6943 RepID=A0AAQ4D3X9_AMBAM
MGAIIAYGSVLTASILLILVQHCDTASGAIADKRCVVAGETFREAKAGCTETTCDEPSPKTRCGSGTVRGCFCREGLHRNRQKACVLPTECP